jgi:hypothetical protein
VILYRQQAVGFVAKLCEHPQGCQANSCLFFQARKYCNSAIDSILALRSSLTCSIAFGNRIGGSRALYDYWFAHTTFAKFLARTTLAGLSIHFSIPFFLQLLCQLFGQTTFFELYIASARTWTVSNTHNYLPMKVMWLI